jgi:hypothetical protein
MASRRLRSFQHGWPSKNTARRLEVTSAEAFADDTKRGERMAVEAIGIYFDYRAKAFT